MRDHCNHGLCSAPVPRTLTHMSTIPWKGLFKTLKQDWRFRRFLRRRGLCDYLLSLEVSIEFGFGLQCSVQEPPAGSAIPYSRRWVSFRLLGVACPTSDNVRPWLEERIGRGLD